MTKKQLLQILKNPKGKVIAVDLDGTLTTTAVSWNDNTEPIPNKEMIEYCYQLMKKGAIIIIYTARPARRATETYAWLDKNDIPYTGVMMKRKPVADVYLDDKGLNLEDIW